jgi:hypothetical protein
VELIAPLVMHPQITTPEMGASRLVLRMICFMSETAIEMLLPRTSFKGDEKYAVW